MLAQIFFRFFGTKYKINEIMNRPKYNYCKYNRDFNDPKGGTKMKVQYYYNIPAPDDKESVRVQTFDCGYRVTKETLDYSNWNQVIYKDIDYKFYYWNNKEITPIDLYVKLVNKFEADYPDIYLGGEISRHNESFHFFFGFDCDRTELNRNFYNEFVNKIIIKVFIELELKHIIEYPKVFDTCTDSIYQLCYITKNHWTQNPKWTGKIDIKPKKDYSKNEFKKECGLLESDIDIYYYGKHEVDSVEYIDHHQRWHLFISLAMVFKDDEDRLKDEWNYCAELIPEENNHTKTYYHNLPWKLDWAKEFYKTESGYLDKELLDKFGYIVEIRKKIKINLPFN